MSGFAAVPRWLIESGIWGRLAGSERGVLVAMAAFADEKGRCYPSVQTLADLAGVSHRTAERAVKNLTASGVVAVEIGGGRGRSNTYRIHQNPGADVGVSDPKPRHQDRGFQEKTPAPVSQNPDAGDAKPRHGALETPTHRPGHHPMTTLKTTPPTTPNDSGGRVMKILKTAGVSSKKARALAEQKAPPITSAIAQRVIAQVRHQGTARDIAAVVVARLERGEFGAETARSDSIDRAAAKRQREQQALSDQLDSERVERAQRGAAWTPARRAFLRDLAIDFAPDFVARRWKNQPVGQEEPRFLDAMIAAEDSANREPEAAA